MLSLRLVGDTLLRDLLGSISIRIVGIILTPETCWKFFAISSTLKSVMLLQPKLFKVMKTFQFSSVYFFLQVHSYYFGIFLRICIHNKFAEKFIWESNITFISWIDYHNSKLTKIFLPFRLIPVIWGSLIFRDSATAKNMSVSCSTPLRFRYEILLWLPRLSFHKAVWNKA